ncbi:MAG: diguanylate cyclase/phosphodiesterase [Nitrospirae bacterium]|nr:MAG: diguanylate cyclase/phosphodiesterase [Nitrospirota bacterium]
MVERLKWELEIANENYAVASEQMRQSILNLCNEQSLTVHFQPIYELKTGSVFGHESLTRVIVENPFHRVDELFRHAILTDTICTLDYICRENALRAAFMQGAHENSYFLFVNVCPEVFMSPEHYPGLTDLFSDKWRIPKERIVLEITEKSSITNYRLFGEAMKYYKKRGYKIAIDDFGAGHGGLKMLSIIEPDFVKIDRHFISHIDRATIKYNLVDAVTTACHRIGIRIIAEGIQRQSELRIVQSLGIDYGQGYYFARPSESMDAGVFPELSPTSSATNLLSEGDKMNGHFATIGDICRFVEPLDATVPFSVAFERFISDESLRSLAVVDGVQIVGMVHRSRFLERNILGNFGYGMHLNSRKKVHELMETEYSSVESAATLEEVAKLVELRSAQYLYDDICITRHGKYQGIVAVSHLLNAITERSLFIAKGSNPITGLPGNECIQREIERLLSKSMHFDVLYIDIDNFKPYNDFYGFEKGDSVIRSVGDMLRHAVRSLCEGTLCFIGHIGGDDFIVITRPQYSRRVAEEIVAAFTAGLSDYHGPEDFARGAYRAQNRKGEFEKFDLLSLSIGILSTEVKKYTSYGEVASLASEIKKLAKMQKGFSIVHDRRLLSSENRSDESSVSAFPNDHRLEQRKS